MKREEIENILVMGRSGAGKQPRINVLLEEFSLEQISTGDIFRHYMGVFNNIDYKDSPDVFWDKEGNWFLDDEIMIKMIARGSGKEHENISEMLLGLKAKYFVDNGQYVPDRITNSLFQDYFSRTNYRGKVLDGYPRTVGQARFLLELAEEKNFSINFGVLVDNREEAIIKRLLGRRICPSCKKVFHLEFKPPRDGKSCTECGSGVIQRSDDTEEKIISRLREFTQKTAPAIEYLVENGLPMVVVPGHLEIFSPENVRRSVMMEVETLLE